jgi:hypothetical protein
MHRGRFTGLWISALPNGLYKVEYGINDAFGRSIMCMQDGEMLGGNSAFAHLGSYQENGEEIIAEITSRRHNEDPHYKPLMGADVATIPVRGRAKGTPAAATRIAPSWKGLHWRESAAYAWRPR